VLPLTCSSWLPRGGTVGLARQLTPMLPEVPLTRAFDTPRTDRIAGVTARPCRAPHHTISDVGLIGGGRVPAPGEGSRAHHGVLCLDELPEFRRYVLEVLRQPLEEGSLSAPPPEHARHTCAGGVGSPRDLSHGSG
jgi:magnesium chelatase family protein